jgi:hypothetical protein
MRTRTFVAAALAVASFDAPAKACAVCATGDTTLAPESTEASFMGRVQAGLDYRQAAVEAGGITVDDHRLEAVARAAVSADVLLSLGVPVLLRDISAPAEASLHDVTFGDVELRMNRVTSTWTSGGLRQRLGVMVELKLPTAPLELAATGAPLSSVLQPGCGALVPAGGFDYALGKGAFTGYAGLSVWLPFAVRSGYHAGDSIRVATRLQWQPAHAFALRAGGNVNADTSGAEGAGATDPNSGGVVGYAAAEITVAPLPDLVVTVGALYPVFAALLGDHREGPVATATLTYDF